MSEVMHLLDEVRATLKEVYVELRDKPPVLVDKNWWAEKLEVAHSSWKKEDYSKTYKTLDLMLDMVGKYHPKLKRCETLMEEILA